MRTSTVRELNSIKNKALVFLPTCGKDVFGGVDFVQQNPMLVMSVDKSKFVRSKVMGLFKRKSKTAEPEWLSEKDMNSFEKMVSEKLGNTKNFFMKLLL